MTDPVPALESRFLEPTGWRWDFFTNGQGKKLRYGMVMPPAGKPDALVVVLPGLSEFCEKYFEIARAMLERNLGLFVLDWRGQGKSDRYLDNPHKRHSEGFDRDVADLHQLTTQQVLPAASGAPLVMLAHSMGGNIGLRYLRRPSRSFRLRRTVRADAGHSRCERASRTAAVPCRRRCWPG